MRNLRESWEVNLAKIYRGIVRLDENRVRG
jgi:hypothetical protein